jgi:hypothetical protein
MAATARQDARTVSVRALPPFIVLAAIAAVIAAPGSGALVLFASLFGSFIGVSIVADLVLGNLLGRFPSSRGALGRVAIGASLLLACSLVGRGALATQVAIALALLEGGLMLVKLTLTARALALALDVPILATPAARAQSLRPSSGDAGAGRHPSIAPLG